MEGGYRDRGVVSAHIALHVKAVEDLKCFGALVVLVGSLGFLFVKSDSV